MSPILSPSVNSAHMDVVRVFLYARQSYARADGSEVSTEAQLAAGHALAEARSLQGVPWVVVGEYVDKGRSGWDPSVIRTDFERMMTDIRAGEGDVVISNELSRLTRQGAHDALEIDKEFKAHGVRFMSILEPFLDTSTPIGVAIFALIAALAKQDSDNKADRLKGAKAEISAVGGRHSATAPYGMRTVREQIDKLTVSVLEPDADNPEHVAVVERMVDMSLSGKSDNKIATTLEKEQIPAPGNAKRRATEKRLEALKKRRTSDPDAPIRWRAQTVRWILDHPAIGGFASTRVKRGKAYVNVIARDEAGSPLTPHRGIISGARWLELQEHRKLPSKYTRQPGGEAVPTLLSGWRFSDCGVCTGSVGQSEATDGHGTYMCANPKGHGGLSIRRKDADEYVARRVWQRLITADMADEDDRAWVAAVAVRYARQKDLAGVQEERRETAAHLAHVRQSIKELQADRKAGLYRGRDELTMWRATMEQYRAYEDECTRKLDELDAQTSAAVAVPADWFASGEDPIGDDSPWATWDVFERRQFLALFLSGVTIGRGRDPETKKIIPLDQRIELRWHPLPDDTDDTDEEATERELAAL
ncbi:recombinase family protein [Streptomyces sp. NPDC050703]|uniref:recombinase family protein n=1 Tax=Streptomyces sp. NPDC050703 TaxID=3157218 RepID=UPI00343B1EED